MEYKQLNKSKANQLIILLHRYAEFIPAAILFFAALELFMEKISMIRGWKALRKEDKIGIDDPLLLHELPMINMSYSRTISDFEVEGFSLSIKGKSLDECINTVHRIKRLFPDKIK